MMFHRKPTTFLFATLLSLSTFAATTVVIRPASAAEPTNAQEAAAKKSATEDTVDQRFAKWKASLSPEQQAWETVLEENLGGFYLPLYKKAKVAGHETAWDYVEDTPGLPRVLLIGDSISRGYTRAVRKQLAGKVNVHRAPENCGPTSNGLKKLPVWLGDGHWDVIHFNFGIHDRKTPLDVYEQRLEELVKRLKATGATVVWASTTPIAEDYHGGSNADLVNRNEVAARVMQRHAVATDDLYNWILPDLAKYQNPHDVHFGGPGYDRLGEQVARSIEAALAEKKSDKPPRE